MNKQHVVIQCGTIDAMYMRDPAYVLGRMQEMLGGAVRQAQLALGGSANLMSQNNMVLPGDGCVCVVMMFIFVPDMVGIVSSGGSNDN